MPTWGGGGGLRDSDLPKAGVTGSCEPSDVGVGKFKSSARTV